MAIQKKNYKKKNLFKHRVENPKLQKITSSNTEWKTKNYKNKPLETQSGKPKITKNNFFKNRVENTKLKKITCGY